MIGKQVYIKRFKEIYHRKNGAGLPDDKALEYFEHLVTLVATITSHISIDNLIKTKNGKR